MSILRDGAIRFGALLCLVGAYQFATSSFDLRWLAAMVAGTALMASGPWHWMPDSDTPPPELPWPSRRARHGQLIPGWTLMALAAVLKALHVSPRLTVSIWLPGALWLLAGAWRMGKDRPVRVSLPGGRSALWCGLLVVGFPAALRLWNIDTVPRYVHIDESTCTLCGWNFFQNPDRDWFESPAGGSYAQHLALFYAIEALGTLVFGVNLGAARLPDALLGTLSVALVFDGVRRVSNLRVATVGAVLLAASHCHLGFSRIATAYIQTAVVVSLAFALFARIWTAPTYLNAVGLGLAMALGIQTYQASMAALPLLAAAMVWLALVNPDRSRALRVPVALFAITVASAALTVPVAYWQNLEVMTCRSGELSVFNEINLQRLKDNVYRTDSTVEVLARNLLRGLLIFYRGEDPNPQYGALYPLADRYTASLLVPGVILAVLGLRGFLAANALVFTAGYLVLGLGLQAQVGYNRVTGALPLAMVLPAIGLVQAAEALWHGRSRWLRLARNATLCAAVVACAATNLRFYFVEYPWSRRTGDMLSEAGWVAREYYRQYTVHLLSWPESTAPGAYDGLRLITFGLPIHRTRDDDLVGYVARVEPTGADLFVLNPQEVEIRDALLRRFPDARVEVWRHDPAVEVSVLLVFVGGPRPAG